MRVRIFVLLGLLIFGGICSSQAQTLSTEGRDFWVGFMNNWLQSSGNPIRLELYLSAKDTTRAVIDMPANLNWDPMEVDIFPERATVVNVPTSVAMAEGSGNIQNIGLHIISEDDISVYAMNKRQWSADISVILPAISLGKNYLATAHWEPGNRNDGANSQSEILVLSIADSTEIVIDPSVDFENSTNGDEPFSIILNKGQIYQIQAYGDLTGTHIYSVESGSNSCSNFAVFAGNRYTKVGQCDHPDGHDHLYAQMYPTNTWGKSFITIPLESRSGGDYFKILASQDSTEIQINSESMMLNTGEVRLITLEDVSSIEADKPISVVQFSRSQACDNSTSDPFMIVVSPKEQLLERVTFNAPPGNNLEFYFMNVLALTSDLNNIFLDNSLVSNRFRSVPFDSSFSYAQIPIVEGNHTLQSNEGFIAYVYWYGPNESFGFATGASLENLVVDIDISDPDGNPYPTREVCRASEILFTAKTENPFTDYLWDFGDGTIESTVSPGILHSYDSIGTYLVKLIASVGNTSCALGGSETSFELVFVTKPEMEILGPRSVCPNTPGVLYEAAGKAGTQYQWWALGGSIPGSTTLDSVNIDWGPTNSNALIKSFPTDAFGCPGDTVYHEVKINIELEPEAPFGPDSLCSTSISELDYYTYSTPGSEYFWDIENGIITAGQGAADIDVSWNGFGTGKLWFLQTSSIDSICAGVSDTLSIFIERAPPDSAMLVVNSHSLSIGEELEAYVVADTIYQWANWRIPGKYREDTTDIGDKLRWEFNCQGSYGIEVTVFDTLGLCQAQTFVSDQVTVNPPIIEMITVTHSLEQDSTLDVRWKAENVIDYPKSITLFRRNHLPSTGEWQALGSVLPEQNFLLDTNLPTSDISYAYRLTTNEDCTTGVGTAIHNSILLDGEYGDNLMLNWNEYKDWRYGVDHYEIWKDVDGAGFNEISSGNALSYEFLYDNEGFEICFRVRGVELDGNNSEAWSNEYCEDYFPELVPYNVFSPNDDEWNQTFVIDGIHMYPNSVLSIVNRYGKRVHEVKGYQNDWSGTSESGSPLAAGVYFWTLQLNEPRVDVEYLNGEVSILY